MDPIAHTLFGATMAEAGLKRKTALATTTLIIGANIPDIDALAMFVSEDYALLVRRGWTHGILALLFWPFLLTGAMLGIDRLLEKRRLRKGKPSSGPPMHPKWLLLIAFIGVWSHPLLDWLNTYGIRLLMPFDGTWFYGDTLFIIDAWFWLLAGAGVVLARSNSWKSISAWIVLGTALTALITTADMVPLAAKIAWLAGIGLIAAARMLGVQKNYSRPIAIAMLAGAVLYTAFMYTGARMTTIHAKNHFADEGVEIVRAMANPLPARPLLRSGVAASGNHYYLFVVNWTKPDSFRLTHNPVIIEPPDEIVKAALEDPGVQGLQNWIRFPHYEVRSLDGGGKRVFIRDLRYVQPDQETAVGIGIAVVDLDEELRVVRVEP